MKDIINITDYKDWLQNLKGKIQQSQIKAAIQVNSELLRLYWQIGKDIVEKQAQAKFRYNWETTCFPIRSFFIQHSLGASYNDYATL